MARRKPDTIDALMPPVRRRRTRSQDRLRKTYLSLYLEPAQAAALRALSARTRVPAQVYLREGVDLMLKKYKVKVPS